MLLIRSRQLEWVVVGYFAMQPATAFAYLGPGLGMTASVVLTMLVLSIVLSVFYLTFTAIRRAFRGRSREAADRKVRNDL